MQSADVQKAAPSPVEPSDTVTDQTSAEVIGNVIGALVRDTSGMTDSGRAVNDPRISPKPITQTEIVTEQAQLFALPEGPPVSIIRQDIPRAGNVLIIVSYKGASQVAIMTSAARSPAAMAPST